METVFCVVCVAALLVLVPCAVVIALCLVRLAAAEKLVINWRKQTPSEEDEEAQRVQNQRERLLNEGMANLLNYSVGMKKNGGDG